MSRAKKEKYILATFDLETDPFKYKRVPKPFVVGFYSELTGFLYFWGDNCIRDFINFLYMQKTPFKIYAHNGGKFDFHYLLEQEVIENPIKIINRKIVKFRIGCHEIRDSVKILPIRLADYQKDDIDYKKLEKKVREKHKAEILSYLKTDCTALFDLVQKFRNRFGDKLTIGGVALNEIKKMYQLQFPFGDSAIEHDTLFRQFYFGGRVQAFKKGIFRKKKFKIYDVNSMYPYVMAEMLHPFGLSYIETKELSKLDEYPKGWPYFIEVSCKSAGAFPLKTDKGLLDFPHAYARYHVTGHEFNAALELGLLSDITIHRILIPKNTISFKEFVEKYISEKIEGKESKNKAQELFAKFLLNNGYGKLSTNPESYLDYYIRYPGDPRPPKDQGYTISEWNGELEIWSRPAPIKQYYDVATGASITGGARSVLLRAIAKNPGAYYCDTDCLILDSEFNGEIHPTKLGAWDFEASGDTLAVCGKKLYCLLHKGEGVKKAHKGSVLDYKDILSVAQGNTVKWANSVPSFSLVKATHFVKRDICMT